MSKVPIGGGRQGKPSDTRLASRYSLPVFPSVAFLSPFPACPPPHPLAQRSPRYVACLPRSRESGGLANQHFSKPPFSLTLPASPNASSPQKVGHVRLRPSVHGERAQAVTAADPSAKHRRPGLVRRHTRHPQLLGRSQRERERERQRDDGHDAWHDERESFPHFCMTCKKQFVTHDERFLYCSEACHHIDQNSTPVSHQAVSAASRVADIGVPEPRDIIPRATPSRPTSIHLTSSPPSSPGTKLQHSSAISALRSLNLGPSSPPLPTSSSASSMWPFGRSTATSPGNSYTRASAPYLSAFDGGSGYTYASVYDSGADRPLPLRHPGTYSRPKSIELVTPVVNR